MSSLLITGGAGFIGCNFVHYWLAQHPADRVVVLDALTYAGNAASLEPCLAQGNFRFVHGDIRDETLVTQLLLEESVDTIVHFAAESHVDRSIAGPDAFLQTNVLGTHTLLKAARAAWLDGSLRGRAHRFHHVSTDEVYGSLAPADAAFHEGTPYAPNSPYAASKAASDHIVRAYHRTYGLAVTTSNCSNNYGPYQFPEKLVPLTIINIAEGRPIPIYGDGRHRRDWLHVHDHCRALDAILRAGEVGETYNIGGMAEVENLDLVGAICQAADALFGADAGLRQRFTQSPCSRGQSAQCLITFVRDRPGHDRRYAIDSGKAARQLGYAPATSLQAGLQRTVAWFLEHEEWWRSVMDGRYRDWIRSHYELQPGGQA